MATTGEGKKEIFGFDAFSPREVSERVESIGVTKARLPLLSMSVLGILAGGFIGLGAMYFTLVVSDQNLSFALQRVIGGLVFSLGLILVVVAGAELFTGNNLMIMAWVSRRISSWELLRNYIVVYLTNLVGALGLVLIVFLSNHWGMAGGQVGLTAVKIAAYKTSLSFPEAFFKGVLCNILVCLAVWLALAGRSVIDKIFAIIFPISAFVAAGFEHSIANMYFIPIGILLRDEYSSAQIPYVAGLDWLGFVSNLIPVTLGNLVGGSLMVGLVYHIVYLRGRTRT